MSADAPTATPRARRWLRWTAYGAGGGAAAILTASAIVLGPAGPSLAAALANGRDVWRLGELRVEGVAGSALGNLRVKRATLADEEGVWAIAENMTLTWEPLRLLVGDVALKSGGADKLIIVRVPTLAPPKDSGPVTIDTDVGAIRIARIELAEGVAGPAAVFAFEGGVATRRGAVRVMKIDLDRLDAPLDALRLDYHREPTIKLTAQMVGKPGGAFAHLLGAPDAAVDASAQAVSAADDRGAGAFQLKIGALEAAKGDLEWTAAGWKLTAAANLDAAPALADLGKRFGPLIALSAAGDALAPLGAPFQAKLTTPELTAEARGKLDDELKAVGAVRLIMDAPRIGVLAPELDVEAGKAHFLGAVEFEDKRTRVSGRAALEGWRRAGVTLDAEGPVDLRIDAKRYAFEADLAGDRVVAPLEEISRLLAKPRITVRGAYDRAEGVTTLERLAVTGPDFALRGAGRSGKGQTLYRGTWSAPHLNVAITDLTGAAQGNWRFASAREGLALDIDGAGRGVSGRSPLAGLLGGAPSVQARLTFGETVSRIDFARLEGRALRLGANGVMAGAPTNIRLEASARGPVDIASLRLSGAIDATGAVTGSLERPHVRLQALLGAVDVAGVTLEQATVGLDLAPERGGQAGRVTLAAQAFGKPLDASARLALRDDAIAFDDVQAKLVQLEARGRASFAPDGPSADLRLAGAIDGLAPDAIGKLDGALHMASLRGETEMTLNATLARARFGPKIAADALTVSLAGSLEAMAARYAVKGWASDDPFTLSGGGTAGFGKQGFVLSLGANGDFAGAPLAAREPVRVRMDGTLLDASAKLTIAGGQADLVWRSENGRLAASGEFDRAPLHVLTAFLDQPLAGTIDGAISLSGAKQNLSGELDFTLRDARLARRSRDAVEATIKASLGGGMLRGRMEARSGQGLRASVEGHAPVIARAAPFQLAPANGGVGQAHWKVSGPVEGLWDLFGPLDQALAGRIEGEGDARFGKAGVTGAGELTLSGGSFEDKQSGVKLRAIEAFIAFDDEGVRLDRFAATDGRQGAISGAGRLDGPNDGVLNLKLSNMRLLDRADARAIGGGAIAVTWKEGVALLTGDIELTEADVRAVGTDAPVAVATIEVVEINRAGPPTRMAIAQSRSTIPARFDVRVHAPARMFTRTRGLDAEWQMDVRLQGDAAKPLLFGEARLIRGDFMLAGRRFELESGEIRFSGAPEDAEASLIAVADTPDLSVRVQVSGPALTPEVTLSSTPALPEDEILPQLLFGRSSRELSGFEAAQLAASLASLAGQSAFDIAGAARSAVDLDRLEVREENGGLLVSGGKYLTRDVYLEVSRGALGQAATAVEWQVRPRLYVISSFRGDGDQRIALRWKKDY